MTYWISDPTNPGMVLDEVQNAPALMSYVQGIADENPNLMKIFHVFIICLFLGLLEIYIR